MRGQYINSHEGLQTTHCEFALGVLGEAVNSEVEPTFGVDPVASFEAVVDAAEPILGQIDVH